MCKDGPALDVIVAWARANLDVTLACRGLGFQEDQRIAAYASSPWITDPSTAPSWSSPPNRIQLVVQRSGTRA